ncbi:MAG: hypothetical protein JNM69_32710 [Archangium sp.]|nr:hypothetical protein [Archangium sp.]
MEQKNARSCENEQAWPVLSAPGMRHLHRVVAASAVGAFVTTVIVLMRRRRARPVKVVRVEPKPPQPERDVPWGTS